MTAGDVGVIGKQNISRLQSVEPEFLQLGRDVSAIPRMNIGSPRPIEIVSPLAVNNPTVKSSAS